MKKEEDPAAEQKRKPSRNRRAKEKLLESAAKAEPDEAKKEE